MSTKDGKPAGARPKDGHNVQDGKVVSLGRDIQFKIGQHLRTMYDEVVKQGVPDHFNDLLQQLQKSANTHKTDDDKPSD
jgi:hypothetical protein